MRNEVAAAPATTPAFAGTGAGAGGAVQFEAEPHTVGRHLHHDRPADAAHRNHVGAAHVVADPAVRMRRQREEATDEAKADVDEEERPAAEHAQRIGLAAFRVDDAEAQADLADGRAR